METIEITRPAERMMHGAVRSMRGVPRQLLADAALLLVTAIWGGTFVMVKDAVAVYPVFGFMAVRFTLAALALLPLVLWRWQSRRSPS